MSYKQAGTVAEWVRTSVCSPLRQIFLVHNKMIPPGESLRSGILPKKLISKMARIFGPSIILGPNFNFEIWPDFFNSINSGL